jgi:ATP-binding cassette subfamily B protein/ATP-binding cassette subfamily C protein/ATP-binding cassette subfamily B multidrug efflux pump
MNEQDDFELKRAFAFVPQETFVMSANLKENVFLDYQVDQEPDALALEALLAAEFDPQHEGLPQGLLTEVGERGVNLSGGQRQRITLARVLTSSAPVILMDDALSAVDVETEAKLMKNFIKGALKDRTRILVTHRLSVLKETDSVLFLVNGSVAAFGRFEQLFAENAAFRDFTSTLEKTSNG